MIHFISSHDRIGSSIWTSLAFTVAFVHSRQVLLKLHCHAVKHSKASNLPFTLAIGPSSQVMSWSSPPWSHDSMLCLMCNKLILITCVSFAISLSHHHRLGIYCSRTCTCGLITCVSHLNTLVHLRLSLNYQNQTRTFHTCDKPGHYAKVCEESKWRPKKKSANMIEADEGTLRYGNLLPTVLYVCRSPDWWVDRAAYSSILTCPRWKVLVWF